MPVQEDLKAAMSFALDKFKAELRDTRSQEITSGGYVKGTAYR